MIALDSQPISLVDDVGFCSLLNLLEPRYNITSRKYIDEKVIPQVFENVKVVVCVFFGLMNHLCPIYSLLLFNVGCFKPFLYVEDSLSLAVSSTVFLAAKYSIHTFFVLMFQRFIVV